MESEALKSHLDALSKTLAAIEVSSDMHAQLRADIAARLDGLAAEAERDVVPAVRGSEDADLRDGAARLFRQLAITNSWLDSRDDRTRDWIDRAVELATSDVLRDLVLSEQNRLRDSEAFSGIRAMCAQGLVDKARREVARRRKAATDPVLRKRLDDLLADPRNFLGPLRSAPSLMTINGVGAMMHGERDRKSDGTYVATHCLVFFFIPILPIRSYLVSSEGNGWRFYGRVPLSPFAFWYRRIAVLGPILAALAFWGWESWQSSPYIRETQLLSKAAGQKDRRDYGGALTTLASIHGTKDADRAARVDSIASSCLTLAI